MQPVAAGRSLLHYQVPRGREEALVGLLQTLEERRDTLGVEDVTASLASLEEVFLNIAKQVGGGAHAL